MPITPRTKCFQLCPRSFLYKEFLWLPSKAFKFEWIPFHPFSPAWRTAMPKRLSSGAPTRVKMASTVQWFVTLDLSGTHRKPIAYRPVAQAVLCFESSWRSYMWFLWVRQLLLCTNTLSAGMFHVFVWWWIPLWVASPWQQRQEWEKWWSQKLQWHPRPHPGKQRGCHIQSPDAAGKAPSSQLRFSTEIGFIRFHQGTKKEWSGWCSDSAHRITKAATAACSESYQKNGRRMSSWRACNWDGKS